MSYQPEAQLRQEINATAARLAGSDLDRVKRELEPHLTAELRDELFSLVDRIHGHCIKLKAADLSYLGLTELRAVAQALQGVVAQFSITEHGLDGGSWQNVAQELQNHFRQIVIGAGGVALEQLETVGTDAAIQKIRKSVDHAKAVASEADQTLGRITKLEEETDEKVAFIVEKLAFKAQGEFFEEIASRHGRMSRRWLVAAVAVLSGAVLFAVITFWGFLTSMAGQAVPWAWVAARLAVLSVLTTVGFWAARHYSAHQHNLAVTEHRQKSINTFLKLTEEAGVDEQLRSALLLHATHAIFGPHATGFSKQDETQPTSPLLDILKSGRSGKG
ncbi:hypothetical protein ACFL6C_10615 [Myxococcota bacterium]